jgi:hypothetical protein
LIELSPKIMATSARSIVTGLKKKNLSRSSGMEMPAVDHLRG